MSNNNPILGCGGNLGEGSNCGKGISGYGAGGMSYYTADDLRRAEAVACRSLQKELSEARTAEFCLTNSLEILTRALQSIVRTIESRKELRLTLVETGVIYTTAKESLNVLSKEANS